MKPIRFLSLAVLPALLGLACAAGEDAEEEGGYGASSAGGFGSSSSGGSSYGGSSYGGAGGSATGGVGNTGGSSIGGGGSGGQAGAAGASGAGGASGGAGGSTGGSGGTTGGSGGASGGSGGASGDSGGASGGSGGVSTNDCCKAATTPGCSTSSIQTCVCAQDKFCCNTAWDSMCVQEVKEFNCGDCGGTGGTGGSGGGGTGGTGGGGTGGTGGTPGCTGTTAFECGNTANYCSNGTCYKCPAGQQNCNGIGGCECSGTCNGSSCTTCTDAGPEPNNTVATASSACPTVLCNINDCNSSGSSVSGVIQPGGDVDFFKFKGWDDLCIVDPTVSTKTAGIQVCVFAACTDGSAAYKSCKQGTVATEGAMTGCCTTSTTTPAQLEINCPGIFDDANVYIRVKGQTTSACTPYDVSYHY